MTRRYSESFLLIMAAWLAACGDDADGVFDLTDAALEADATVRPPIDGSVEDARVASSGRKDAGQETPTTRCTAASCPFAVGPIVVLGSEQYGLLNLSVAASSDGKTVAVGYCDYDAENDDELSYAAKSTNGGLTFDAPVRIPGVLAWPHVAVSDDGKVFVAGTRYRYPDDGGGIWLGYMELSRLNAQGAFERVSDLMDLAGERYFALGSFAISPDGKQFAMAWLDQTPKDVLPSDAAATPNALWAAISQDQGATFKKPEIVSKFGSTSAPMSQLFFRDGRLGVTYAEDTPSPANPLPGAKISRARIAIADRSGKFGEPSTVHNLAYSRVKVEPASAVGKDGRVHIAWWSETEERRGIWYSASSDGASFSTPIAVANPERVEGAGIQIAVDGDGSVFVGIRDVNTKGTSSKVRLFRLLEGMPVEIKEAAVETTESVETFDLAGLPGGGVVLAWLAPGASPGAPDDLDAATPGDEDAGAQAAPVVHAEVKLRRVVPASERDQ